MDSEESDVIRALEDEVAQVVDGDGNVVAASDDAPSAPLPRQDAAAPILVDDEPVIVLSEELDDGRSLLVGVSVEDDAEAVATVSGLLAGRCSAACSPRRCDDVGGRRARVDTGDAHPHGGREHHR